MCIKQIGHRNQTHLGKISKLSWLLIWLTKSVQTCFYRFFRCSSYSASTSWYSSVFLFFFSSVQLVQRQKHSCKVHRTLKLNTVRPWHVVSGKVMTSWWGRQISNYTKSKFNISKKSHLTNHKRYFHNPCIILKIFHYVTFHSQTKLEVDYFTKSISHEPQKIFAQCLHHLKYL